MKTKIDSAVQAGVLVLLVVAVVVGLALVGRHFHQQAKVSVAEAAASDLWVDAAQGDDGNRGTTPSTAFRTIQKAANEAGPGTIVHILPGVYRESVRPAIDGLTGAPIVYLAEEGPGTVVIRGSEPSSSLQWVSLSGDPIGLPDGVDPSNVYYADLSAWDLGEAPRFVVELDAQGGVEARLPLAREPDWHVETDWRYHELWWTADGGSRVSACDPSDPENDWNCDLPSRCENQLTDVNRYPEPDPRIDGGDLTSLGDLTGARLIALDAKWGHYFYRRRIVDHEVEEGRITVDGECLQDGGASDPGLGWGSKYYLEDHPALLDSPGEWWYDEANGRLYMWPPAGSDPATMDVEISKRDDGFDLTGRSHIVLDGLTVEIFNRNSVKQGWGPGSRGNIVRNSTLRYADYGVVVLQSGDGVTRDFRLEDSEIAYIDSNAFFVSEWWDGAPSPGAGWQPSIRDIVIKGNEMHHLGFRADTDNAVGVKIQFANQLRFEENHVHDVAHNGVQFSWSVIESDRTYDFSPDEIKSGGILVKDNVFEGTCQLTTDCAGLKFWGQAPDNHVFRDVLVTGNVFRDNLAWTYVAEQREGWWTGGEGCEVQGHAGFGLYLDSASGIHAYRNVAYNNAYAGFMLAAAWRDGDVIFYNNVVANSLYGIRPSGTSDDTHGGSVNTEIVNNVIVNNEGYGIYQGTADENFGDMVIENNLYYNNGWRTYDDGGVWKPGAMTVRTPGTQKYYQTVREIQEHPYRWEANGVEGDPGFLAYDPSDHELTVAHWPDFHLTPASDKAIDQGAELPDSLTALLGTFGVEDPRWGSGWDVGAYEGSFVVSVSPPTQNVEPGETAFYSLLVQSVGEFTAPVTLDADSPDPRFKLVLSPDVVTSDGEVTLTVTDTQGGGGGPYSIPVVAAGGGFTRTTTVGLWVGGSEVYLPLAIRGVE
jgi:hypothetical protein